MHEDNAMADSSTTLWPVQTRACLLPLDLWSTEASIRKQVGEIVAAGFNTVMVPVLRDGELLVQRRASRTIRNRVRLTGATPRALNELEDCAPEVSRWLYIDPIRAAADGAAWPSAFARRHRPWLMRNTHGRLRPLGAEGNSPLFSWMNRDWRRFLCDLVIDLAQEATFTGLVLDGRAWPGESPDPARWYCCSFESQQRAEDHLHIAFEHLMSDGSQIAIERWRQWQRAELTGLVHAIKAALATRAADVGIKVLLAANEATPPRSNPLFKAWTEKRAHELLIEADDNAPLDVLLANLDAEADERRLILPGCRTPNLLSRHADALGRLPFAGWFVLDPATPGEVALPPDDGPAPWTIGGAIEDEPLDAAEALAAHLRDRLGNDSKAGRFYLRVNEHLAGVDRESMSLEHVVVNARTFERRIESGDIALDPRHFAARRAIGLLPRVLAACEAQPRIVMA